jgi:prevent-host-death family protein
MPIQGTTPKNTQNQAEYKVCERACARSYIDLRSLTFMESVTAFEAKTRFGLLLKKVARGEEIIITRYGKPVARLIPEGNRNLRSVRKAVARIFDFRKQIFDRNKGKPKLTVAEVKSWIVVGRR